MRRLPVENKTLVQMGESITIQRNPDFATPSGVEFYFKDSEFQQNKVYRVSCLNPESNTTSCYVYFDKPVILGPVQIHNPSPTPTGFYGYYADGDTAEFGFAFENDNYNVPQDWIIINLGNAYYLDMVADW